MSQLDVDDIKISKETKLIEDLHYDSITLISLIIEIETHFKIVFDYENLYFNDVSNVESLYNMIVSSIKHNGENESFENI